MAHNDNKRVITLGESLIDLNKSITYNPIHHYDEEVEFVNDQSPAGQSSLFYKETQLVFDDASIKSKIASISQDIYDYY
jgi:hypothetical protein